jgi:hypothetical protein
MACWPLRTWRAGSVRGVTVTGCKGDYVVNVKEITPHRFPVTAVLAAVIRMVLRGIWPNHATYRRACMLWLLIPGKSF